MNAESLVSVIIPTYNRAHTISRAIDSVLNQTYKNIELIIVDDASIDNTIEIIKNINDKRIISIIHDKNKGISAARNTGIRLSKGKYVAFLDSDDEWDAQMLLETINNIENRKIDIVFSYGEIIMNNYNIIIGRQEWINKVSKEEFLKRFYSGNLIYTQGIVIKKSKIFESGLFDETFDSVNDHELWIRLLPLCNYYYLDKKLFKIYISDKSVTKYVYKRLKNLFRAFFKNRNIIRTNLKTQFLYYSVILKFISNSFYVTGWDLKKRNGSRIQGIFFLMFSFIICPSVNNLKQIIGKHKS